MERFLFGYLFGMLVSMAWEDKIRRWHNEKNDPFAVTRRQIRELPSASSSWRRDEGQGAA